MKNQASEDEQLAIALQNIEDETASNNYSGTGKRKLKPRPSPSRLKTSKTSSTTTNKNLQEEWDEIDPLPPALRTPPRNNFPNTQPVKPTSSNSSDNSVQDNDLSISSPFDGNISTNPVPISSIEDLQNVLSSKTEQKLSLLELYLYKLVRFPTRLNEVTNSLKILDQECYDEIQKYNLISSKYLKYLKSTKSLSKLAKRTKKAKISPETVVNNDEFNPKETSEELTLIKYKCLGVHNEKIQLVSNVYDMLDNLITQLDKSLREYEIQIRKEGHWDISTHSIDENQKEAKILPMPRPVIKSWGPEASKALDKEEENEIKSYYCRHQKPKIGRPPKFVREKIKIHGHNLPLTSAVPTIIASGVQAENSGPFHLTDFHVDDAEQPVDPNEPLYCICRQVSFGEMIACDNSECLTEWFHIRCVGLSTIPDGKWYCPSCIKN